MQSIRLLIDPPAAGAWNMAVDEALLDTVARGAVATLRFYQWEEPTLSLGYFQAAADRQQHVASSNCPLVRRGSGGGAIVHDKELTYSIALSQATGLGKQASQLYDACHETLAQVLAEFGVVAEVYRTGGGRALREQSAAQPFLCFQRRAPGDVLCEGAKIAGSAQRRRRQAVLQHGSILLAGSQRAPELPGILEAAGGALLPADLIDRWTPRLAGRLGLCPQRVSELAPEERRQAEQYVANRFGAESWTMRH